MVAKITFFPVGNGDMTLIETDSGRKILIDCHIRGGSEHPDVLSMLKQRLVKDSKGRLYIDVFIWSHPDKDHCGGIESNFYLGDPSDWSESKHKDLIFINEIWSSPLVYRRAHKENHTLCSDAIALNREVKRRVKKYKADHTSISNVGDQVLILSDDENGKTDDIPDIVISLDQSINIINNAHDNSFSALLLAPSPKSDFPSAEEELGKNHSSVILNISLKVSGSDKEINFLTAGDAEVVCWEVLLDRLRPQNIVETSLIYDILQTPHHCSWHTLSHDSLSARGENAQTDPDAIEALSQAKDSAYIIASSKAISEDDCDPPAYRAKQEYVKILERVKGTFKCVADNLDNNNINVPLELVFDGTGFKPTPAKSFIKNPNVVSEAVNRRGKSDYA